MSFLLGLACCQIAFSLCQPHGTVFKKTGNGSLQKVVMGFECHLPVVIFFSKSTLSHLCLLLQYREDCAQADDSESDVANR
jgi:hypothetical protein